MYMMVPHVMQSHSRLAQLLTPSAVSAAMMACTMAFMTDTQEIRFGLLFSINLVIVKIHFDMIQSVS